MSKNNTFKRVIVSLIFIPGILYLSYYGRIPFVLFILAIGLISFYEFMKFSKLKNSNPQIVIGLISVGTIILNKSLVFIEYYDLLLIIVALLSLVELFRNKGSAIHNVGVTLLGILYIGFFASSILSIREHFYIYERGGFLVMAIIVTIWICDSAAFFGGINLGKHRLFPRVSPKKSWEGAMFGFVFSILSMVAAKYIVLEFLQLHHAIIIGAIVGTIGQMGDLVESLFKRDAGVKDSSNLIPGHGGIFDRFDSLFVASPVVFLYIKFFVGS
jgi:phosphatidate cytidylyltransferase